MFLTLSFSSLFEVSGLRLAPNFTNRDPVKLDSGFSAICGAAVTVSLGLRSYYPSEGLCVDEGPFY